MMQKMKEELKLDDNLNSEIVKIVNLDKDKYEIYFNFLSIPVEVNRSYLNTILTNESNGAQMQMTN